MKEKERYYNTRLKRWVVVYRFLIFKVYKITQLGKKTEWTIFSPPGKRIYYYG